MSAQAANEAALARLFAVRPHWQRVVRARDAIGLPDFTLLHAGPPYADPCNPAAPVMSSAVLCCLYEKWASTEAQAEHLIASGHVKLLSAQSFGVVTPLAAVISPASTLVEVADPRDPSRRAWSLLGSGAGAQIRFGGRQHGVLARLAWRDTVLARELAAALEQGPIDLFAIAAEGLAAGDDLHARTTAATAALRARLSLGLSADLSADLSRSSSQTSSTASSPTLSPASSQALSPASSQALSPASSQALSPASSQPSSPTLSPASSQALSPASSQPSSPALPASVAEPSVDAMLSATPLFFLTLWMAACHLMMSAAADGADPGTTLVVALAGNGREVGVRLAGKPHAWTTKPAHPPAGPRIDPSSQARAAPLTGDSGVIDAAGFGAHAFAHAPEPAAALSSWLPADWRDAQPALLAGVHPAFGALRCALDAAAVARLNIEPLAAIAMIGADGRAGLLGRGVYAAPVDLFHAALNTL